MRKITLLIFLLMCCFSANVIRAQEGYDAFDSIRRMKFRSAELSGDEAWRKGDTTTARIYYERAVEIYSTPDEIHYRLEHLHAKPTCRFDDTVNLFFSYVEKGRMAGKDHQMRQQLKYYDEALALARTKGYEELKDSGYYRSLKKSARYLRNKDHPVRRML